jgi:phytanoyl-CoA hydroxylase
VLGLWFALEDATVDNGCLYVAPGGHKGPLRARFVRDGYRTDMVTLDATPLPSEGLVPLEVPEGTLVVLHGLLPHGSTPNRSARSRHAYALHVIDGCARYSPDNWLQRAPGMPLRGF